MKRIIIIVSTLLHGGLSDAQTTNSLDSVRQSLSIEMVDSLKGQLMVQKDSITMMAKLNRHRFDSLSVGSQTLTNKLDSARFQVLSRLDSLKSSSTPDTLLIKQYTQLQTKLDSLKGEMTLGTLTNANGKIESVEQAVNSRLESVSGQIKEITNGEVNVKQNVDLTELPGLPSVSIPNLNGPEINNPLSKVTLPDVAKPELNADQPTITSTAIPGMNIKALTEIEESTKWLSGISGDVKQYKEELAKIKEEGADLEKLSEKVEKELAGLDAVKGLEKELGVNPLTKNWNDPEVMKEMAFNKGKEQALNHFAGHEQELMAAMEQFSKIRSQIKNPEGTIDMLKKQNNPMKDKKFVERLVTGLALQLQKPGPFWFDLNPSLGYKLSGKFTLHAGWNYRWAYASDEGWLKSERIYGPRTLVEFTWRQYFSFVGIAEVMSSPLKLFGNPSNPEYTSRDWIWSYMVGTKTSYTITKSIKGNAQVLYNLYDPDHQSPYGDRLNVRMGVEFVFKLKKNATEGAFDH